MHKQILIAFTLIGALSAHGIAKDAKAFSKPLSRIWVT